VHPDIRKASDGPIGAQPAPGRVPEVGQRADEAALIDLPVLADARERVAFGPEAGGMPPDVTVLRGHANDLSALGPEKLDLVPCNSMLEHEPRFRLGLAEMRRVIRRGGHMILGVPGYGAMRGPPRGWRGRLACSIGWMRTQAQSASAPTPGLHGYPSTITASAALPWRRCFSRGARTSG
jgi:SAM-dependent methyltransferase